MTLQECTALLAPVALAFRADIDEPTFRAYHVILKDAPVSLAELALEGIVRSGARFFPGAPEILIETERVRRRQLALYTWDGCVECEDQLGWRELLDARGEKRLQRCPCRARHQMLMESRGLLSPLAQLPGEVVGESEQVYPTLAQLPGDLRDKLQAVAARKALR